MEKTLVLIPRLSEKAYGLSQKHNTYVFDVPAHVNRHSVARAVSAQFAVSVKNVNIANIQGKAKRTIRKGGRAVAGRQSDIKKAFVTLQAGDTIAVFAVEEGEKKSARITKEKK